MLDGLLGRGFAPKCKALIKLTKSRIDVIRRKRKATEKFLKKDIADLLADGLDISAHGRAEGLLAELTLSSCYDFIEKSCDFVLKHLSVMQKLSGCPEECRDAVSSLMFAAARFSDLPELRELRQIFQERYENSLEYYVNQEFAANVNSMPPTLEKKVCLMQEISLEFSIMWDSKAFEQRMQKSSALAQDRNIYNLNHLTDYKKQSHGNNSVTKGFKCDVSLQQNPDHPKDGQRFHNGKEADVFLTDDHNIQSELKAPRKNGVKKINGGDDVILRKDSHDNRLLGRPDSTAKKSDSGYWKEECMLDPNGPGCSLQGPKVEHFNVGAKLHDSWGNTTSEKVGHDTAAARKPDLNPNHTGLHLKRTVNEPSAVNCAGLPGFYDSERKAQKDETSRVKPCYSNAIPPPYVKPNSKQKNSTCEGNIGSSDVVGDGIPKYPSGYEQPHANSKQNSTGEVNIGSSDVVRDGIPKHPSVYDQPHAAAISEKSHLGLDNSTLDSRASKHARQSRRSREKELFDQEDMSEVPVLKPKSTRRKHSKSRSSHNNDCAEDAGVVTRRSRSRRRDESRPRHGLQTLFDDEQHRNDEEERMIDKLLIHYSKKPSIPLPEKARRKSRSRHAHEMDDAAGEFLKNGSREGPGETPEMVTSTPRSISLPREETGAGKVNKVFTRAATFQADGSREARHVHPKLPDYDELAARIAALRGT